MKKDELIGFIQKMEDIISKNIKDIFDLSDEEIETLINNLYKFFEYCDESSERDYSFNSFSKLNLYELKDLMVNMGLNDDKIKKIVVKSPVIILYSHKLKDIYFIYKKKDYCGYTVLDNKKYDSFLFNENLKSNIVSNNILINRMLDYYKMEKTNTSFDALEDDYKLKNYYLKKKKKK